MTQFMRTLGATAALCSLTACVEPDVTRSADTPASASIVDPIGPLANPEIVDADTNVCHAVAVTPALIETVTQQVIVPEVLDADGTIITPATFRTDTRQDILRDRQEVEFETPCDTITTPPFIASVQRALIARGYYTGAITGELDAPTKAAVKRYQIDQDDVHTDILTLATARSLGLVAVPRDAL